MLTVIPRRDAWISNYDPWRYEKHRASTSVDDLIEIITGRRPSASPPRPISLELSLAGFKREDVEVSFDDASSVLTVKAKRGERLSKSYHTVDATVYDIDRLEAKMEDGLLTVSIPLLEKQEKKRRFEVK